MPLDEAREMFPEASDGDLNAPWALGYEPAAMQPKSEEERRLKLENSHPLDPQNLVHIVQVQWIERECYYRVAFAEGIEEVSEAQFKEYKALAKEAGVKLVASKQYRKTRRQAFLGAKVLGTHGVAEGKDCVAAGNLLQNAGVPRAMVRAFEAETEMTLPERLLIALEEAIVAGGEAGPVHSAALLVVDQQPWALVDLRVDWADENPIGGVRQLWEAYRPQMNDYVTRALDPSAAPSYGVPGDQ